MVTDVHRMKYTIPLFQKVRKVSSKTLQLMRLILGNHRRGIGNL